MRVFIETTRNTAMVYTRGQIKRNTQVGGTKENNTV